jgi:hypothetical protein
MDIENPQWEEYENRFRALADTVQLQKGPQPELASAKLYLCLYGDNAMTPEQEFEALSKLEAQTASLRGTEMQTAYWEDIFLYLPS